MLDFTCFNQGLFLNHISILFWPSDDVHSYGTHIWFNYTITPVTPYWISIMAFIYLTRRWGKTPCFHGLGKGLWTKYNIYCWKLQPASLQCQNWTLSGNQFKYNIKTPTCHNQNLIKDLVWSDSSTSVLFFFFVVNKLGESWNCFSVCVCASVYFRDMTRSWMTFVDKKLTYDHDKEYSSLL